VQIVVSTEPGPSAASGAVVLPIFADRRLEGSAAELDLKLRGAIAGALDDGEHQGKAYEVALFHATSDGAVRRVLLVGLGDRARFEPWQLARYAGTAIRYLGKRNVCDVAITIPGEASDLYAAASFIAEGAIVATIDTTVYRREPERPIDLRTLTIVGSGGRELLEAGSNHGRIVGESVNYARRLALEPANQMTPRILAKRAEEVAKEAGLSFDALDEERMRELGMGALLSVSQGSSQPARLIVLTHEGDPNSRERLALIGKGITFDSGGISLKPHANMHEMKYDMCGGAAVIAALRAIGLLRLKLNVVGVIPASENLPGPDATKPGDIHIAMNGKTIEVVNTDAEGRLILADALVYATMVLGATRLLDAATLTGTIVDSLGHAAAGAMSNDDAYVERFLRVANKTGERYWRLPIYDDYLKLTESEIADLKNFAERPAATLIAAAFLREFVDGKPWIHLDVSGTAYLGEEKPYQAKGPTGIPMRSLLSFVASEAETST
jgi:leucyl aminopeptidase